MWNSPLNTSVVVVILGSELLYGTRRRALGIAFLSIALLWQDFEETDVVASSERIAKELIMNQPQCHLTENQANVALDVVC